MNISPSTKTQSETNTINDDTEKCPKCAFVLLNENEAIMSVYKNLQPSYANEDHIEYLSKYNSKLKTTIEANYKQDESHECIQHSAHITGKTVSVYKELVDKIKHNNKDDIQTGTVYIQFNSDEPYVSLSYNVKPLIKIDIFPKDNSIDLWIGNNTIPTDLTYENLIQ